MPPQHHDAVIIGSGFGGSVAALRLAQKGYSVAVLEAGRRWRPGDFPKSNWDARKYLWLPTLGLRGLQRMAQLRHLLVVGGAGVGGGSLIYGNTLFTPLPAFFQAPFIRDLGLEPFYDEARRMMGVTDNPRLFEPDAYLREVAAEYRRADSFTPSPVGVFFGEPGEAVPDPYFQGEGPERRGCNFCGGCFVGCREGAKNSLDLNYLYLAEKLGARIVADTEVRSVRPLSPDGAAGYQLDTVGPGGRRQSFQANRVVVAAGVLGTLKLLLRCKRQDLLPGLSDQLGRHVRTNSETIIGVRARGGDIDFSKGIAASSSVFPDEHTQVQGDRYPAGSDFLALVSTLLVDGGGRLPRPLRLLGAILRHPLDWLRSAWPFGFARRAMVLVVMQDHDTSLRIVGKRKWYWPWSWTLASRLQSDQGLPSYIPIANDFARRLAKRIDGVAMSSVSEVFLNAPATAHILGGCVMAERPEEGVVDAQNRAYGYQNLMICDGSVIPANLGVNPALSILAFAERALSFVPPRG